MLFINKVFYSDVVLFVDVLTHSPPAGGAAEFSARPLTGWFRFRLRHGAELYYEQITGSGLAQAGWRRCRVRAQVRERRGRRWKRLKSSNGRARGTSSGW